MDKDDYYVDVRYCHDHGTFYLGGEAEPEQEPSIKATNPAKNRLMQKHGHNLLFSYSFLGRFL